MNSSNRYLAIKVRSDLPLRYRLIRQAKPDERTGSETIPLKLVLLLKTPMAYRPVVTLSRGGLPPCRLMVDVVGMEVELPEELL